MKSAVIIVIVVAYAMAAPSTGNARQSSRQPTANTAAAEDRSSSFGFETQNVRLANQNSNPFLSRNRLSFDDDVTFITSDLSGRQVAFQNKETAFPVVNRGSQTLNGVSSVPLTGQRGVDLIAFDNSGEIIDDLDDLDDIALFSSADSVPFVSQQNAVRLVAPSMFNPVVQSPIRQSKKQQPQFVQVDQNSFRAPTTCTCPPQQSITRFQPSATPARQFFQLMEFPQRNRFFQPSRFGSMFNTAQFPGGVQIVLDD